MSNTAIRFLFHREVVKAVFALMLLPFVALTVSGQPSTSGEVQILSANQPIERQIRGGETHVFRIDLNSGQYTRAEVEQRSIDAVVSLFAPDGKLVVEMDGKNGYLWRESVSCIAGNSSVTFQVKVRAHGTAEEVGNYTIRLAELRPAETGDGRRLEAEQHFYKGRKLFLQEKPDYEAAIKEYQAAAKIWSDYGDKHRRAVALINSGWVYNAASKNELALTVMEEATLLFRETGDRVGEGKAANGIGNVYGGLGQYDKAARLYEQALEIRREIKDMRSVGNTLHNLGLVYANLKQIEKAISYYEEALVVRGEMKDSTNAADTLGNLGIVYYNLKQYEKAGEYYQKELALRREIKDRSGAGDVLRNLGLAYYNLKQYEKAKDCYEQLLEIKKEPRGTYGHTLLGLGNIHYELKQYEKAKDRLEQALTIAKDTKDRQAEDNALLGLRIISSPTTASTSQRFATTSVDDGWPLPPLVARGWKPLDKQESQDLVDRLVNSASVPELGFIGIWARRITQFRTKQLPFYPGAQLCEGLESGDGFGEPTILSFVLLKDGTIEFLNGTSPPIHTLNKKASLALNTQEQVESYLRFFTAAIWGEAGNFRIVDGIEDPLWARDTLESDKQRVAKYMRPLVLYQPKNKRMWRAIATMQYQTSLFRALLYINQDTGMVEMADDMALAVYLPVRRDRFDGALRYELGVYK